MIKLTNPADVKQLQTALYESHELASALMRCAIEGAKPTADTMADFGTLMANAHEAMLGSLT